MQQIAKIPVLQQTGEDISYSGCSMQIQAALPNLPWKAAKNPYSLTEQLLFKVLPVSLPKCST